MVTKTAIREARLKEIKQEMLASNKLKVKETIHLQVAVSLIFDELHLIWVIYGYITYFDECILRNKLQKFVICVI